MLCNYECRWQNGRLFRFPREKEIIFYFWICWRFWISFLLIFLFLPDFFSWDFLFRFLKYFGFLIDLFWISSGFFWIHWKLSHLMQLLVCSGQFCGSHGLDARRAQRTKSRGQKLEIGIRREGPQTSSIFIKKIPFDDFPKNQALKEPKPRLKSLLGQGAGVGFTADACTGCLLFKPR